MPVKADHTKFRQYIFVSIGDTSSWMMKHSHYLIADIKFGVIALRNQKLDLFAF